MRKRPDIKSLLEFAGGFLKSELVKELPNDKKIDALMVANVIAIAARQLENGHLQEREAIEEICQILDKSVANLTASSVEASLSELNSQLGRKIRRGDFDPDKVQSNDVYRLLLKVTRQGVAEYNPKYLSDL